MNTGISRINSKETEEFRAAKKSSEVPGAAPNASVH